MKYLMDNVHGSITLHDHEVKIIDHMLFQRLRYIKQNDILYLTFMGATHTRFSHSLGVMHMGSKIFDILFPMEMYVNDSASLSSILYLKRVLRMALLFHDTGHAAFSHLTEHLPVFHDEVYSKPIDQLLWRGVDDDKVKKVAIRGGEHGVEHEHYSIRAAFEIMKDNKVPVSEMWDVLSIMEGFPSSSMSQEFNTASEKVFGSMGKKYECVVDSADNMRYLLHFILSSEADADKLDYLRRDSLHAGVGYGGHDIEGLLNSMKLAYDKSNSRYVITVSETGLSSLCDMVDSRYKLYSHISNNIGNNGAEIIFEKALNEVMSDEENKEDVVSRMCNIGRFQFFTDDFLMSMISERAMLDHDSYCYAFLSRKRARHLATFRSHEDKDINRKIEKIKDAQGKDRVSISVKKIKFSEVDNEYRDIMVRRKSPSGEISLESLAKVTSFFDSRESFTQYGCYLA